ncbi:MAG: hypothetical protein NWE95_13540 [Candidatus Bathyarchaeota archaeon]|nr:hypothetical protein [Candidatus Bathyarchaeota archaeon]
MVLNEKINTKILINVAKASEHKEAYQPITKTVKCRVGVGARLSSPSAQQPTFFVEVIINMCPACSKVDIVFLERALACLKKLEQNGYTLTCQDDNTILCEKVASEKALQKELKVACITVKKLENVA